MTIKRYRQIRVLVALFVMFIVSLATSQSSYLLAAVGVLTGMLFMILARSKTKITIDEREKTVREKAAQLTYAIFTPIIGLGAFMLLIPYQDLSPVFANGEFAYLQSIGMVLAYLTLFLIAVYALAYHFINRKLGGGSEE